MSELTDLYLMRIQSKPSHPKYRSFLWADYIELLCIANADGELSHADVFDRLLERELDLAEADDGDLQELQELNNEQGDQPTQRSEIPDRWENNLSSWFNVLYHRQVLYGETYPFEIEDKTIKRKANEFTENQKLYCYLLLCSNLYLFNESNRIALTSSFEMVSFNAFRNLLPQQAVSHVFGANPLNHNGEFSQGSLWQKITRLSSRLNEVLYPGLNENNYVNNVGDGGLDLVAWLPTGDSLASSIIYFGQCACTEEWVTKQYSSSHDEWSGKIVFKNYINNSIFIPFCFRAANGSWFRIEDIKMSFLVDRKRLLHYYFQQENIAFNTLPAYQIVEEIITTREDVI